MLTRKLQLIAGTSYSLSLPKHWVLKNKLKEKQEVLISEKNNGTLVIYPYAPKGSGTDTISLKIDDYLENIDDILPFLYHLGIENITIFSSKDIPKKAKARIRKQITHMSGTVITYEDNKKIAIRVLLDKSKINILQIFYRISIILESSIAMFFIDLDLPQVNINENEIDRLYHLSAKLVSLSLTDSNVLYSSNMNNISQIPYYFLISKKLENIGDNVRKIAEEIARKKQDISTSRSLFNSIILELNRSIRFLMNKRNKPFDKLENAECEKLNKQINMIDDENVKHYASNILRYICDIQSEVLNISYHNQFVSKGLI